MHEATVAYSGTVHTSQHCINVIGCPIPPSIYCIHSTPFARSTPGLSYSQPWYMIGITHLPIAAGQWTNRRKIAPLQGLRRVRPATHRWRQSKARAGPGRSLAFITVTISEARMILSIIGRKFHCVALMLCTPEHVPYCVHSSFMQLEQSSFAPSHLSRSSRVLGSGTHIGSATTLQGRRSDPMQPPASHMPFLSTQDNGASHATRISSNICRNATSHLHFRCICPNCLHELHLILERATRGSSPARLAL